MQGDSKQAKLSINKDIRKQMAEDALNAYTNYSQNQKSFYRLKMVTADPVLFHSSAARAHANFATSVNVENRTIISDASCIA